ncbi:hypothetical protein O7626_38590 [Micromonospora sp. WMMD1102]|uniref:hypothetical protein n=1 Tax=Micromonospora sp. WMMD1102 TaxID=3016105 RepID=UPI002414FFD2|nr:hypothetical protein [Micromonospora sp. WMMD1102]MDG4791734.1 hypothetical protein [Micromonospora sp. WMMD1102]
MRSKIGRFLAVVAMALPAAIAVPGVAGAAADRSGFTAQARAAGLSVSQAAGLQAEVDAYLANLAGRGRQVSPNQIDMNGAMLTVTVPGEMHPRQFESSVPVPCDTRSGVDYGYFCAYQKEWGAGAQIAMYNCANYPIPWQTVGSWINNQTTGTRPVLYFSTTPPRPPWTMPPAYAVQLTGVDWTPVGSITNC